MKPKRIDRGGRPRNQPVKAGEKVQLGVRVTPRLRASLDKAAKLGGRSLTQEAEIRLERSFDLEVGLKASLELAFGKQIAALLIAIGLTSRHVAMICGVANDAYRGKLSAPDGIDRCLDEAWTANEVKNTVEEIVRHVLAHGRQLDPEDKKLEWLVDRGLTFPGHLVSNGVIEDLKHNKFEAAPWAAETLRSLFNKGEAK